MKCYPLAHLTAVTMSCFCAELQALQLLFPNSASGIARALPSFLLYIFECPDSRCGPLVSVSDNLNPFQRCRGGKHKLCTYGAGMAKSRWAGIPPYAKTTDLSGSIFSSMTQMNAQFVFECWLKCKNRYWIWFMRKCSLFRANECIFALLVAVSRK